MNLYEFQLRDRTGWVNGVTYVRVVSSTKEGAEKALRKHYIKKNWSIINSYSRGELVEGTVI